MSTRADLPYSPAWRRGTELLLPGPIRAIMKRDWHGQENIPRQGGVSSPRTICPMPTGRPSPCLSTSGAATRRS